MATRALRFPARRSSATRFGVTAAVALASAWAQGESPPQDLGPLCEEVVASLPCEKPGENTALSWGSPPYFSFELKEPNASLPRKNPHVEKGCDGACGNPLWSPREHGVQPCIEEPSSRMESHGGGSVEVTDRFTATWKNVGCRSGN